MEGTGAIVALWQSTSFACRRYEVQSWQPQLSGLGTVEVLRNTPASEIRDGPPPVSIWAKRPVTCVMDKEGRKKLYY